MRFALKESWLGLRNSTTRLPFRYGKATLSRCPQAVLEVAIEVDGRLQRGYSGDCLPPGWFDKAPGRSYREQVADMIGVIGRARAAFARAASRPISLFESWREADAHCRADASGRALPALLVGFGVSLVERAIMDALARSAGLGFAEALRSDLFAIEPGAVHEGLTGLRPADWLPETPRREVFVRHTVGLGDPLTVRDIAPGERVGDGLPQAFESYVEHSGLRFAKVKLSADVDADLDRLRAIAAILERHRGADYRLTLDGNELFGDAGRLRAFVDALRSDARLGLLAENVLAIEQPLGRSFALDADQGEEIRIISAWRPVIIDESDATADAFPQALALGYRGVTSKNCKGPTKAILNAGLCWSRNDRGRTSEAVMTGEDLCSVGVVPVQADLCLAATLGLSHVERNGHHYHPGLSYLPESAREAALAAHPDLYARKGDIIGPAVRDGRFAIGSLRCVGFGFAVLPDRSHYEPVESWQFDSLGLADDRISG
ncbi:mandelate racemase [Tautonia sp. JC769]|uniref:mandelate racemase n=1 Tax=Tautonia sp. JC769 TaxID=3232135 RepID=UPI00345A4B48